MVEKFKKRTRISTGGGDVEDRLSDLPDEIIHQILALVSPGFRPGKLSVLSKRWNRVWRSYPILEFDPINFGLTNQSPEEENLNFSSCKKFFQQRIDSSFSTDAVRITITVTVDFVDELLNLTSKMSPRAVEIRAIYSRYSIPTTFLLDPSHCHGDLKVLALEGCDFPLFWDYSSLAFGFSLKVLNLEHVRFPADGILNSMIASAPLLESLTLEWIRGVSRFRVRDHPNLKVIEFREGFECFEFEIVGARSLESLRFSILDLGRSEMSSLPNLKLLHIGSVLEDDGVSNLHISEFPSLESLTFERLFRNYDVRVVVSNQLWEARLTRSLYLIETEASDLASFDSFVSNLGKTCRLFMIKSHELKQFLNELSQFRPTLQVQEFNLLHLLGGVETYDLLLPAPVIDRLKLQSHYLYYHDERLLDHLLCACHPRLLCLIGEHDRSLNATTLWVIEYICKQFMERAHCTCCRDACLCWRSQLKDAKMVTRRGGVEEENVVDIGQDMASSLADGTRVSFILTWH